MKSMKDIVRYVNSRDWYRKK